MTCVGVVQLQNIITNALLGGRIALDLYVGHLPDFFPAFNVLVQEFFPTFAGCFFQDFPAFGMQPIIRNF